MGPRRFPSDDERVEETRRVLRLSREIVESGKKRVKAAQELVKEIRAKLGRLKGRKRHSQP